MTGEEAFHQAILEDPDDDTVRLVYADWLAERGDARGEFIRVQVELARLPEGDQRAGPLALRERALLDRYKAEWTAPLRPLGEQCEVFFRRGFIRDVFVREPIDDDALACLRSAPTL